MNKHKSKTIKIMKQLDQCIKHMELSIRDTLVTSSVLFAALMCGFALRFTEGAEMCIPIIFIAAVFIISRTTEGFFYGTVSSIIAVSGIDYIFKRIFLSFLIPSWSLLLIFFTMLSISTSVCTVNRLRKEKARLQIEVERERMNSNLLRSVSHDIRTPLTAIMGFAESLLKNGETMGNENRIGLVEGINGEAAWLLRMVENLLSITRLGNEGADLVLSPEIVEEVVGAAAGRFRKWHPGKKLIVRSPDELILANMDAVLIKQVLLNMLDNAVKHSCGADEIILDVKHSGDCAVFRIMDNGKGIAPDEFDMLFSGQKKSDFLDGDKSRSMGIGLSVCRTIVKAHGGRIFAGNRSEGGAVFIFTLPLTEVGV
ncbi:MAG: ATP-binding protein [Clostridiaceae bacterium]|nr:ATP-binding protein [Clostridiaceae bacterium]